MRCRAVPCHTPCVLLGRVIHIDGMNTADPMIPREKAAALIGIAPRTLSNWNSSSPPRGPRPAVKTTAAQQGRTLYRLGDVAAWQADPAAYERRAWADRGRRRDRSRPR